jgi:shikimate kinase
MQKVVLVGYMGSGKSIISKLLAHKIHFSFLELDEMIEENAGMSVQVLFEKKGELYFRKLEHQLFLQSMKSNLSFVLSTGGGTPCYFNNHDLLKQDDCISIYLKASVDTLYHRLINEKRKRPLLSDLKNDELKEFIAKHLFERSFYYNQAKFSVVADNKTPENIVEEISKLL